MSGGVWKAVETCTREIGVGEAKRRRSKEGTREKERKEEEEEKTEKRENDGNKESSRGMGEMR